MKVYGRSPREAVVRAEIVGGPSLPKQTCCRSVTSCVQLRMRGLQSHWRVLHAG
jgi:hypothetical protein